jgi:hypothetical protein
MVPVAAAVVVVAAAVAAAAPSGAPSRLARPRPALDVTTGCWTGRIHRVKHTDTQVT